MALSLALPLKNGDTDDVDTRYDFRNLVACNADGSPHGGVTSPLAKLITGSATMVMTVVPFSAIVARDGGAILLAAATPTPVTIPTAPTSGSRKDLIYAKQHDTSTSLSSPDADDTPTIGVITGTPAASNPANPTPLPGTVVLGYVTVPAGATVSSGFVVDYPLTFTAAAGAPIPFPTASAMFGYTPGGDTGTPTPGSLALVFADGQNTNDGLYRYQTAKNWQPLQPIERLLGFAHREASDSFPAVNKTYALFGTKFVVTLSRAMEIIVECTANAIGPAGGANAAQLTVGILNGTTAATGDVDASTLSGFQQAPGAAAIYTPASIAQSGFKKYSFVLAAGTYTICPVMNSGLSGGNHSATYIDATFSCWVD